jgi:hypothetical protein
MLYIYISVLNQSSLHLFLHSVHESHKNGKIPMKDPVPLNNIQQKRDFDKHEYGEVKLVL